MMDEHIMILDVSIYRLGFLHNGMAKTNGDGACQIMTPSLMNGMDRSSFLGALNIFSHGLPLSHA